MRIPRNSMNRDGSNGTNRSLSVRERVLEAACESFAESGFHGTHLREICKRAGTNVAGVCYHFQSKEGLYQAVMMEAGRQLSDSNATRVAANRLSPEERLLALTESLLRRFNSKRAWIAKLLARELIDCADNTRSHAASRLEKDFVLLQAAARNFLGADDTGEVVRLHVLTLIGECVFYSLVAENPRHPLNQFAAAPSAKALARFLTQRSLKALRPKSAEPEFSDFTL
jgi:AcrR family transcriptional regulator